MYCDVICCCCAVSVCVIFIILCYPVLMSLSFTHVAVLHCSHRFVTLFCVVFKCVVVVVFLLCFLSLVAFFIACLSLFWFYAMFPHLALTSVCLAATVYTCLMFYEFIWENTVLHSSYIISAPHLFYYQDRHFYRVRIMTESYRFFRPWNPSVCISFVSTRMTITMMTMNTRQTWQNGKHLSTIPLSRRVEEFDFRLYRISLLLRLRTGRVLLCKAPTDRRRIVDRSLSAISEKCWNQTDR